jgi:hypothetical protein
MGNHTAREGNHIRAKDERVLRRRMEGDDRRAASRNSTHMEPLVLDTAKTLFGTRGNGRSEWSVGKP